MCELTCRAVCDNGRRESAVNRVALGCVVSLVAVFLSVPAEAATGATGAVKAWRFDFTDAAAQEKVRAGYAAVLPDTGYTPQTGFGWRTEGRIRNIYYPAATAVDKRFPGRFPLMKGHYGSEKAQFVVDLPDGTYNLFLVTGFTGHRFWRKVDELGEEFTKPIAGYPPIFCFDVTTGARTREVFVSYFDRFDQHRLDGVEVTGGKLAVTFDSPEYKYWLVNAMIVYPASDEVEMLGELEALRHELYHGSPDFYKDVKVIHFNPPPQKSRLAEMGKADALLFTRPRMEKVFPDTRPLKRDMAAKVSVFATRGEFEPVAFSIHAARELRNVEVKMSDLLMPGSDAVIPAGRIHVGWVENALFPVSRGGTERYLTPTHIVPMRKTIIPAGESRRCWITVHVPEDAKAGTYEATAAVASTRGELSMKVEFTVLPFQLAEQDDDMNRYYRPLFHFTLYEAYDSGGISKEDYERLLPLARRRVAGHLKSLREHGYKSAWFEMYYSPLVDGKMDLVVPEEMMRLHEKEGFTQPPVIALYQGAPPYGAWTFKPDISPLMRKTIYNRRLWTDEERDQVIKNNIEVVRAAKEMWERISGGKKFWFSSMDEPWTDTGRINARDLMAAIRKAFPKIGMVVSNRLREAPELPMLDAMCCLWYFLYQDRSPEEQRKALADIPEGMRLWCYDNGGGYDPHPGWGRTVAGLFRWRFAPVRSTSTYGYVKVEGLPFLNNAAARVVSLGDQLAHPIQTEAQREGHEDYLYLRMLEDLVAECEEKGLAKVAGQGQALLTALTKRVGDDGRRYQFVRPASGEENFDPPHFKPAEWDLWRTRLANGIIDMLKELGRIPANTPAIEPPETSI